MINYLFDIDGTLTPSREKIDDNFKHIFADWVLYQQSLNNKVFFVTGSDRDKTVEQVGVALWRLVDGSYQCCGKQLYKIGKLSKESKWKMSAYLHLDLMLAMEKSPWFGKARNNIEERIGMVNFTTLGRSATTQQRKAYHIWDNTVRERERIAKSLSFAYPKLEFSVGGEISIDIYPKGKNKSQALKDMVGKTVFFGDRCEPSGNDFPIYSKADVSHHVSDWTETCEILRNKYSEHKGS